MQTSTRIEPWLPGGSESPDLDRDLEMLAEVLHAVVHDGAGVSFVFPFDRGEARNFWADAVLPGVRTGTRHVLVARDDGRIVGTVQIDCATPPNQPHRADVLKLLVHPSRGGVALPAPACSPSRHWRGRGAGRSSRSTREPAATPRSSTSHLAT